MAGMRQHLGKAARAKRKAQSIKAIRIAYALDKTEASLSRFERGESWPKDVDEVIAAYAAELDTTPLEIWTAALEAWRLSEPDDERFADDVERQALPVPVPSPAPGTTRPGSRRGTPGR